MTYISYHFYFGDEHSFSGNHFNPFIKDWVIQVLAWQQASVIQYLRAA